MRTDLVESGLDVAKAYKLADISRATFRHSGVPPDCLEFEMPCQARFTQANCSTPGGSGPSQSSIGVGFYARQFVLLQTLPHAEFSR